ncbi:MAG: Rrf2 family transcriptional regulator [Ignavibacteriales bacterium]|nr:MAG: Rrf2 family transcriptional regulator [Ignavibacteriales bacterium]
MKFSVQEEYGLRCLIRIAKFSRIGKSLTIPEISQFEGLSQHNVAKILRTLRIGGFLEASRGQVGGYTLAKTPDKIILNEVLECLGGKLFEEEEFCSTHAGAESICTNTIDCSVRSLWRVVQDSVDTILRKLTLQDLINTQKDLEVKLNGIEELSSNYQ